MTIFMQIFICPTDSFFGSWWFRNMKSSVSFGLTTAPRVFIKVFSVVAAQMRCHSYPVFSYLDDWLLTSHSTHVVRLVTLFLHHLLSALAGFMNREKSTWTLTRMINFIRVTLDSI